VKRAIARDANKRVIETVDGACFSPSSDLFF
jgi:hypothetical protein